jgi:hypothetical protein
VDGFQTAVVWQVAHSLGMPAATWPGNCELVYTGKWQLLHAVGVPLKPTVWHLEHKTEVCDPVNGKAVVAWLKLFSSQLFCVWHMAQSVGYPWALWFGAASYLA